MADTNLNDDMVKLVEYTIVCIQREDERPLRNGMQLYVEADKLTGDAFSNARIAEWVSANPVEAAKVKLDTLRVYHHVLQRWPKEDLKFDERTLKQGDYQVEALKEIRDEIRRGAEKI